MSSRYYIELILVAFFVASGLACAQKAEDFVRVKLPNGKVGLKRHSTDKEFAVPPVYDEIELPSSGYQSKRYYFYNDRAAVSIKGKWGFVNEKGEIKIPIEYEKVEKFEGGMAKAMKNNKLGLIDAFNKILIPFEYDKISYYLDAGEDGYYWSEYPEVEIGDKVGLYDVKAGKIKIPVKYSYFKRGVAVYSPYIGTCFFNGYALADGHIIIDSMGNEKANFDRIYGFRDERNLFRQGELYGYLDHNFDIVIKPAYAKAEYFNNGFAIVSDTAGLQGIIDFSGKLVVPMIHTEIIFYSPSGMIVNKKSEKFTFVNKNGQPFIEDEFDKVIKPVYGLYVTENNYEDSLGANRVHRGLVNEEGIEILKPEYSYVTIFEDELACIRIENNNKYGIIDERGNYIVPLSGEYESIDASFYEEKIGYKTKEGERGFFDRCFYPHVKE